MKRLSFILCIITFSVFLSACRTVSVTPANELTASEWRVENPASVSATLRFDTIKNKAFFKITDEKGESYTINGAFAADKEKLYITADSLAKTYDFGYKVYKDRLVLTYNGCELTFYAEKEKEP